MLKRVLVALFVIGFMGLAYSASSMAGGAFAGDKVPRMEIQELLTKLDSSDVMIIDVRRGKDWEGSELMIKNAVRKPYNDVANWAADLPKDKAIVLYCA